MWDPAQYLRFSDERSRPFFDLVGRIRADRPRLVVDLGCGPGNLTAALADRWPDAEVVGVDSSAEMIASAQQLLPSAAPGAAPGEPGVPGAGPGAGPGEPGVPGAGAGAGPGEPGVPGAGSGEAAGADRAGGAGGATGSGGAAGSGGSAGSGEAAGADRAGGAGGTTGAGGATGLGDAAGSGAGRGSLGFGRGDVRDWEPGRPVDVIVSNAVLQWVSGHEKLLPRWAGMLAPGGWLAFQVPGNFDQPSHIILRELAGSPRWRPLLADVPLTSGPADAAGYVDVLGRAGCTVDAWETTYLHVLPGEDPVLEWYKGTGLRPVLAALDPGQAEAFLAEYGPALRRAYPRRPYGTILPFRRLFAVAQRAGVHDHVEL